MLDARSASNVRVRADAGRFVRGLAETFQAWDNMAGRRCSGRGLGSHSVGCTTDRKIGGRAGVWEDGRQGRVELRRRCQRRFVAGPGRRVGKGIGSLATHRAGARRAVLRRIQEAGCAHDGVPGVQDTRLVHPSLDLGNEPAKRPTPQCVQPVSLCGRGLGALEARAILNFEHKLCRQYRDCGPRTRRRARTARVWPARSRAEGEKRPPCPERLGREQRKADPRRPRLAAR